VRRLVPVLVALATTAAAVGIGLVLTADDADEAPARQSPAPFAATPLAEVDTTALTVPRAGFCDAVDEREVALALGAEPTASDTWADGEEIEVAEGVVDVVQEHGCSWRAGPVSASAWVFAPPVTASRAETLGREAARGCEPIAGAAEFGTASVAVDCARTTSYRGLFGDAWLVCELTGADPARADGWCSAVVRAASSAADES
jgi:hypothetical protein